MKEPGSSTHAESSYTGQTVKSWSAASLAEKVQREQRDSAEAKAWRKEEREQKIKQIVTMRRKRRKQEEKGDCWPAESSSAKGLKSFLLNQALGGNCNLTLKGNSVETHS